MIEREKTIGEGKRGKTTRGERRYVLSLMKRARLADIKKRKEKRKGKEKKRKRKRKRKKRKEEKKNGLAHINIALLKLSPGPPDGKTCVR